jgi:hypothetical protein
MRPEKNILHVFAILSDVWEIYNAEFSWRDCGKGENRGFAQSGGRLHATQVAKGAAPQAAGGQWSVREISAALTAAGYVVSTVHHSRPCRCANTLQKGAAFPDEA